MNHPATRKAHAASLAPAFGFPLAASRAPAFGSPALAALLSLALTPLAVLFPPALVSPLAAQDDLYAGRTYQVGQDPGFIAAARLDADALPDLVVANFSSLSRLLNRGEDIWEVLPELPLGALIEGLLVADMNGDGHDDVVTLLDGATVRVDLGNGAGILSFAGSANVGIDSRQIAAGDLDEDGHLDIVTADAGSDTLSVLRGVGNGALVPAPPLVVTNVFFPGIAAEPRGVAVADLDEDGHLDVVSANYHYPSTYSIFFGTGTGTFGPQVSDQLGSAAFWGGSQVAVGDMNEDGHVDLVLNGAVRLGDGNGGFDTLLPGIASSNHALADVNEDGHLDVLATGSLTLVFGDGQGGALSFVNVLTGVGASDNVLVDFDGDGHLDVASAIDDADEVRLLRGDGTGAFPQPPFFPIGGSVPRRLAAVDLDDDGALDVIAMNQSSKNLSLLRGDGAVGADAAGFLPATLVPFAVTPEDMAVIDLDGDGDEDAVVLLAGGAADTAAVLLGDGAGQLLPAPSVAFGADVVALAIGDVNENGTPDLLTLNRSPFALSVRLGLGGGAFGPPSTTPLTFFSGTPERLFLADMNQDAHLDMVASLNNASFSLRHGNGAGLFGQQLTYNGVGGELELVDLDDDGDTDVVGEGTFGFVGVMRSKLGGYTLAVTPGSLEGVPTVGDIDADGHLDIVVAGWGLDTFGCLLGNGAGGFTLHGTFAAGGSPIDTAIADLDGDGFPELVGLCAHSGNPFPEHVTVLFGQTPGPWLGLGHALAGSQGAPKLAGKGTLAPNTPLTLTIADGKPAGLAALVIGGAAIDAPFKGGTLVPLPSVVLVGLPLDASGHFAGSGTWYGGLPPGTATYFQVWMQDAAGPLGWSATNGLQGVTP